MGHSDTPNAYDEHMRQNSPDQYSEFQRLKALYEPEDKPSTSAQETPKNEKQDRRSNEAPENAFSHYLTLANGQTVRYDVGDKPYDPFPQEWEGVPVTSVRNAMGPGKESD